MCVQTRAGKNSSTSSKSSAKQTRKPASSDSEADSVGGEEDLKVMYTRERDELYEKLLAARISKKSPVSVGLGTIDEDTKKKVTSVSLRV